VPLPRRRQIAQPRLMRRYPGRRPKERYLRESFGTNTERLVSDPLQTPLEGGAAGARLSRWRGTRSSGKLIETI